MVPLTGTLFAACHENPQLFKSVFVAAYQWPLDPNGKQLMVDLRKKSASPVSGITADAFRKAWGYQFVQQIKPGSWLIDLDCRKLKKTKVWGCSQVPSPSLRLKVKGETDLTIAIRQPIRLTPNGRQWRLSSAEKQALVANATRILKYAKDEIVPLTKAIQIIDSVESR
jgi:hypothetical protein